MDQVGYKGCPIFEELDGEFEGGREDTEDFDSCFGC